MNPQPRAKSFRDLVVWQLGKDIVLDAYSTTRQVPREERYGLTAQIRRAAMAVPSNIAEGFNRRHWKEYRQFLYVALGSCAELETQIEVAQELQYIDLPSRQRLLAKLEREARMLQRLIQRVTEGGQVDQRPATKHQQPQ